MLDFYALAILATKALHLLAILLCFCALEFPKQRQNRQNFAWGILNTYIAQFLSCKILLYAILFISTLPKHLSDFWCLAQSQNWRTKSVWNLREKKQQTPWSSIWGNKKLEALMIWDFCNWIGWSMQFSPRESLQCYSTNFSHWQKKILGLELSMCISSASSRKVKICQDKLFEFAL